MSIVRSNSRRTFLTVGAAALIGSSTGRAQTAAPLRVILPVSPGSGVDALVRTAQAALSRALGGQPVVLENIAGVGGVIGTQALVKAAPDGNTVAFIGNNHSVNPSVYKSMPFDSLADITPISIVGGTQFVLVANPQKVPAKDAREFQALLRSRPATFNMGSSGNGTIIHLAGEMVLDAMNVTAMHVPYKGMGPMLADILAGHVDFAAAALPAVQGHVTSGRLRAIGVLDRKRVPGLPNLPTLAEQGFPEVDVVAWLGLAGPAKLSTAQVRRLHAAVVEAFNDPAVREAIAKQGGFIDPSSPETATAFLRSDQERYTKLVAKAQIKID